MDVWCSVHACRAAFKALAYKKYQQVPLYLEWAPKDIWDTPPPAAPLANKAVAAAAAAAPKAAAANGAAAGQQQQAGGKGDGVAAAAAAAEDEDGDQAPTVSIYVKNLNFNTSDASLKNHFDKVVSAAGGQIHSAKVSWTAGYNLKYCLALEALSLLQLGRWQKFPVLPS